MSDGALCIDAPSRERSGGTSRGPILTCSRRAARVRTLAAMAYPFSTPSTRRTTQAQKLDPPPSEQKLLKRDMMRLRKLTKHADEARKARSSGAPRRPGPRTSGRPASA